MTSTTATTPATEVTKPETDLQDLQYHLREYCDQQGSQNKAARLLDISPATLSKILAGKVDDIAEKTLNSIASQVMPGGWKVVSTSNFETVQNFCRSTQLQSTMKYLTAYSGAGKTTALEQYARRNRNAFYLLAVECMTEKELLNEIQRIMGLDFQGTKYEMLIRIRMHLLSLSRPLLIIDDAGKLSPQKRSSIQTIYDMCKGHVGILLVSLPYAYDKLSSQALWNQSGAPEFKRRIGYRQELRKPGKEDLVRIAQANGVRRDDIAELLAGMAPDFGTHAELVREACFLLEHEPEMPVDDLKELLSPNV